MWWISTDHHLQTDRWAQHRHKSNVTWLTPQHSSLQKSYVATAPAQDALSLKPDSWLPASSSRRS
jgi:hypothetical protein